MIRLPRVLRWLDREPEDAPIDVWSFRAVERLKVHEARTAAEMESHAKPAQPARWWVRPEARRRVA